MPVPQTASRHSPSSASPPPRSLSEGARGAEVQRLQDGLKAQGFHPGPTDGVFGPATRRALLAFQRARGLGEAGAAGPRTWAALARPPSTADRRQLPTLSQGFEGPAVAELQRLLEARGFGPGGVDGIFGPRTRAAVVAFQAAHGLARDGVCGPNTWSLLRGGAAPPPAPVRGDSLPRTGNAFIDRIAAGAVEGARRYGIPASVSIAQAILESGWGRSSLAQQANNLFGMKGHGPAGGLAVRTREYVHGRYTWMQATFQKFNSQAESISAHARVLGTSPAYVRARAVAADARAFARALTGVYATAPDYGQVLIRLMDEHDLYRFDRA